jgi:hypothetical protein
MSSSGNARSRLRLAARAKGRTIDSESDFVPSVQAERRIAHGSHRQLFCDPALAHRRFVPQPPRHPHFPRIPFAPLTRIRLRPAQLGQLFGDNPPREIAVDRLACPSMTPLLSINRSGETVRNDGGGLQELAASGGGSTIHGKTRVFFPA